MKDLGKAKTVIGREITRDMRIKTLTINQKNVFKIS